VAQKEPPQKRVRESGEGEPGSRGVTGLCLYTCSDFPRRLGFDDPCCIRRCRGSWRDGWRRSTAASSSSRRRLSRIGIRIGARGGLLHQIGPLSKSERGEERAVDVRQSHRGGEVQNAQVHALAPAKLKAEKPERRSRLDGMFTVPISQLQLSRRDEAI
jgi:hypothetical protein